MQRRLRVVSLVGLALVAGACDSAKKSDGDASVEAKAEEGKSADAKVADAKAADAKAEEGGLAGKVKEKATEIREGDEAGSGGEGTEPAATGPVGASGGVIAKVGAVEIPKSEFSKIYDLKVQKYVERGREIPPSAARRYRKSILDRLTYQEALRQEAAAKTAHMAMTPQAENGVGDTKSKASITSGGLVIHNPPT